MQVKLYTIMLIMFSLMKDWKTSTNGNIAHSKSYLRQLCLQN